MQIIFISPQYIKDKTIVESNVSEALISPVIEQVQEMVIHAYLGTDLYEALQNEIENGALSNNSIRKKLVDDYVVPILLNACVDQLIPSLNFKFANKGILKQSDDNSENASKEELEYLRSTYRSVMNTFIERMKDFIGHNANEFPEYYSTDFEDVNPIVDVNSVAGVYTGVWADNDPYCDPCKEIPGYPYPGKWKRTN